MEAYSALTSGRVDRLFSMARLIVGNDDRAADTVQDALLNAWLDLRALRDPDHFDAWLHRVLVRVCYAAAKRHRTRTVVEIKLATIGEPSTADSQTATAINDQLDRAFARLSPEHRP